MIELTREQARALDRIAMEEYGIPGVVLMENAGAGAARSIAAAIASSGCRGGRPRVEILCGGGNNGGDGWVVARHLHGLGWGVRVVSTVPPGSLGGDAAVMARIVVALAIPVVVLDGEVEGSRWGEEWKRSGVEASIGGAGMAEGKAEGAPPGPRVLVDALLGTGFRGELRAGPIRGLLGGLWPGDPGEGIGPWAPDGGGSPALRVSLDLPSGLDADRGLVAGRGPGCAFVAHKTLTFAARKPGLRRGRGPAFCGTIEVVSIGTPLEIQERAVQSAPEDSERDGGPE